MVLNCLEDVGKINVELMKNRRREEVSSQSIRTEASVNTTTACSVRSNTLRTFQITENSNNTNLRKSESSRGRVP
jgi:hypothetical protein